MKADWRCYILASLLAVATVDAADAETGPYPNKPVQILRILPAGSAPDVALRFVADRLTQLWGEQAVVVNRPGGGGSVAAGQRRKPRRTDIRSTSRCSRLSWRCIRRRRMFPCTYRKTFCRSGLWRRIRCSSRSLRPWASHLAELIALAKKRPGEIPYATTGIGRLTHLTGELLQHQAGIRLLLVPYTGGPAHAIGDVTTGRVAVIIEGYSGIAGAARSGSVKLIAVALRASAGVSRRSTVAKTIPGFRATGWGVSGGAGRHPAKPSLAS